jgi:glycosyltransferase involved in cell wall biosynthesis
MAAKRLVLVKQAALKRTEPTDTTVADLDTVKAWVQDRSFLRHLFRYREAQGLTYHLDLLNKPLTFALLLRLFSHGRVTITDQFGQSQPVSPGYLLRLTAAALRDYTQQRPLLRQIQAEVAVLLSPEQGPQAVPLDLARRPLYLRTDLVFGLQSGGSVGHITGVLNHLDAFGGKPLFLSTDQIPLVRPDLETQIIWPDGRFRDYPDLQTLAFNQQFFAQAKQRSQQLPLSFLYQRYSLNNFAGLKLARQRRIPFVLEFNGSEVWVKRNWGKPLVHEALAVQIEQTNLQGAHVVVVVSQPLKDELVGWGIDPAKILVNPNGVDPERYSPQVEGTAVRAGYGLQDKTVIGFIGTFGPWHGAEVLAGAFGRLLQNDPAARTRLHLLLIGDGETMPQVKAAINRYGMGDQVTLTGSIPQSQGPEHLAACDILASPHVSNPDGSRFFGSPTKLFEYMAMGKGIVASDLEQIGEVLVHGETAWLAPPGDEVGLMMALKHLVDNPALAAQLGAAARRTAVARYTWRAHTERIIDKLCERCCLPHA